MRKRVHFDRRRIVANVPHFRSRPAVRRGPLSNWTNQSRRRPRHRASSSRSADRFPVMCARSRGYGLVDRRPWCQRTMHLPTAYLARSTIPHMPDTIAAAAGTLERLGWSRGKVTRWMALVSCGRLRRTRASRASLPGGNRVGSVGNRGTAGFDTFRTGDAINIRSTTVNVVPTIAAVLILEIRIVGIAVQGRRFARPLAPSFEA